jgi:hypothetical protein
MVAFNFGGVIILGTRRIDMFWIFGLHLIILLFASLRAQCEVSDIRSHASCMTDTPDELLLREHQRLGLVEAEHGTADSENRELLATIQIDIWFHIISSEAAAKLVSDEMVAKFQLMI